MNIRTTYRTPDYREAQEIFHKWSKIGEVCMFQTHSGEYKVIRYMHTHTDSETHRAVLESIFLNTDSIEEREALSYADSAIKTLVDMGVLE